MSAEQDVEQDMADAVVEGLSRVTECFCGRKLGLFADPFACNYRCTCGIRWCRIWEMFKDLATGEFSRPILSGWRLV